MSKYPIYNEDTPTKPGLYLGLFHGRTDPQESLDDWGSNGPILGPLEHVHTTYATHIKLEFETKEDARSFGFNSNAMIDLDIEDGMVVFQYHWYGDWIVFYHESSQLPSLEHIKCVEESEHASTY